MNICSARRESAVRKYRRHRRTLTGEAGSIMRYANGNTMTKLGPEYDLREQGGLDP